MRAVADEVAAAADLVKGKADGIPAALVRGLDRAWFSADAPGARALVRVGPGDWFALGHVEAVRAALGVAPGSAEAEEVGIRSVQPDEPLEARVGRVVALALLDVPEGSADVGVDAGSGTAEVTLGAPDDYDLGRLVVRVEVAAASEGMSARIVARSTTTSRWPSAEGAARQQGDGRPRSPGGLCHRPRPQWWDDAGVGCNLRRTSSATIPSTTANIAQRRGAATGTVARKSTAPSRHVISHSRTQKVHRRPWTQRVERHDASVAPTRPNGLT